MTVGARYGGLSYALLYLPVALSLALAEWPVASYLVAWLGSWWILAASCSGIVKPLPADRPWTDQIFRPVFLTHAMFASYMALTSIFYAIDVGVFAPAAAAVPGVRTLAAEIALGQQYYVLAHAGLATGILLLMDYRESGRWAVRMRLPLPLFLVSVAAIATAGSFVALLVPGLGQLALRFQLLALVASILTFATSLWSGSGPMILASLALYGTNLVRALLSGWKEEVIVVLLLLAAFAYPVYRRTVLVLTPALFALLLFVLPTYNQIFRQLAWTGRESPADAAAVAYAEISGGRQDLQGNAWQFLTYRASEMSMFVQYLRHTPAVEPFAGIRLVGQAGLAVVPRIVWPEKPNLEPQIMERVYRNEVVDRESLVSAKPHYIVDGYLAGGGVGVWLAALVLGLLASLASRLAERWFGGYLLGSGLVFTSLFSIMWRGNAFEYFSNNVFWSFAVMGALFVAGRAVGWISRSTPVPVAPVEPVQWGHAAGAETTELVRLR